MWKRPFIIWLVSIVLIYSTTGIGFFLVGSDIHLEYYFANQTLLNGWNSSLPHAYNGALSITLLAPALSKLLNVDLYFIFKWVFPLFYSFVPVVMYFIYRKFLTDKQSFFAAIFMIIVPTFFIEVTGIAKEQIGELFLVLAILCMLNKKWIGLFVFGVLTVLAHYSMGYMLAFYLVTFCGVLFLFRNRLPGMRINKGLILSVIAILAVGYVYLGTVASGVPLNSAAYVGNSYISPGTVAVNNSVTPFTNQPLLDQYLDLTNRDDLVQAGLGMDFQDVSLEGKLFRSCQYVIQLLIILGVIIVIRRKYPIELSALLIASCGILLACVLIPSFANILNPTRFYHLAMLFLPMALVISVSLLFKNWRVILSILAVAYFAFTSGAVFEILKLQPCGIVVPYSLVASHERLDIGTKYSVTDVEAGKWLKDNYSGVSTYADTYGLLIIQEHLGLSPLFMITGEVPADSLIFLRDYNQATQFITIWDGAGIRKYISYKEINMDNILKNRTILWQHGNSVVYSEELE